MTKRYASAASSSALITLSLLFVMQLLISIQPGAESEPRPRDYITFIRDQTPDEPAATNEYEFTKEDLTRTDPTPPRNQYTGETAAINVPRTVPIPPSGKLHSLPNAVSDGPLVALVRVEPVYPVRASTQGIEGYVIVQFDVTPNGRVINAAVVESSHRVFEKSALKAAEKFKFKPRVVDGVALETRGIRNLFRFDMEDQ